MYWIRVTMKFNEEAVIALICYQLIKDSQKERLEIRQMALNLIQERCALSGENTKEKFKGLRRGIELNYYLLHKKKMLPWKAIELSQTAFEKLRESSPNEHEELKKVRDDYKSYQSNRISDLAKNYNFEPNMTENNSLQDIARILNPFITKTKKQLIAQVEFLSENELAAHISNITLSND